MTRDLPEGMIDAEPTGGWVSEGVADATGDHGAADTVQRFQEEAPDVEVSAEVSAEVSQDRSGDPVSEAAVDGAEDADPDLVSDDQLSDDQADR